MGSGEKKQKTAAQAEFEKHFNKMSKEHQVTASKMIALAKNWGWKDIHFWDLDMNLGPLTPNDLVGTNPAGDFDFIPELSD